MSEVITKQIYIQPEPKDYFELLKPRVMRLVVFTALVGLLAAPENIHPIISFASILCVAVGAGACGALNMWWDADIDKVMKRTSSRPIPSGKVEANTSLTIGLVLSFFSVVLLGLFSNYFAAAMLAFTIFFYIIIYTVWLKRLTTQNIVIGGLAGAFPPIIGWIIATGEISFESLLMCLIIFVWTPPHFWALSIFSNNDYTKAKVPMLMVIKGETITRRYIFYYSLLLSFITILVSFTSIGGIFYFISSLILNSYFILLSFSILKVKGKSAENNFKKERKFFLFSIFYLFTHFFFILLESILRKISFFNFNFLNML